MLKGGKIPGWYREVCYVEGAASNLESSAKSDWQNENVPTWSSIHTR